MPHQGRESLLANLGLSGVMTCRSYAPPVVQAAVLSLTGFGRRTDAIGTSARASFLAGINVSAVTVALYALSGRFSAGAAITSASLPARSAWRCSCSTGGGRAKPD